VGPHIVVLRGVPVLLGIRPERPGNVPAPAESGDVESARAADPCNSCRTRLIDFLQALARILIEIGHDRSDHSRISLNFTQASASSGLTRKFTARYRRFYSGSGFWAHCTRWQDRSVDLWQFDEKAGGGKSPPSSGRFARRPGAVPASTDGVGLGVQPWRSDWISSSRGRRWATVLGRPHRVSVARSSSNTAAGDRSHSLTMKSSGWTASTEYLVRAEAGKSLRLNVTIVPAPP
jgi:hypothetical protein